MVDSLLMPPIRAGDPEIPLLSRRRRFSRRARESEGERDHRPRHGRKLE